MAIDIINNKNGFSFRARVLLPNRKRVTKCFQRKIDAKLWESKVLSNSQSYMRRQPMRFNELAEKFLETEIKPNSQPSTIEKYSGVLKNYIVPWFNDCWVDQISKFQVEEFKAFIQRQDRAASVKNFVFTVLKSVLKKGVDWDVIDKNPGSGVKAPKRGMAKMEYWSEDECSHFLLAMAHSERLPLYLLALNGGLRAGEIFGLSWDSVDFQNKFLRIRRIFDQKIGAIKESTKTHKQRFVPINDSMLKALVDLKNKSTSEQVLTPEQVGCKCPSHLSRLFKADARKAGVRQITFHDLRHTFATTVVSNGGNIHSVAGILGHSATSMTERYAHFDRTAMSNTVNKVSFEVPALANVLPFSGQKLVIEGN